MVDRHVIVLWFVQLSYRQQVRFGSKKATHDNPALDSWL